MAPYTQAGVGAMFCEERERLTRIYVDAAKNHRRVSDSIKDIESPEWLTATKEARQSCDEALAALKLHIYEHNC
jgi:hypothetical protein